MSQITDLMLLSTASFIVLILIVSLGTNSEIGNNYINIPPGFVSTVLSHTYGLNKVVSVDNSTSTNNTALVNQLMNTTRSGYNDTNNTDVATIFGVDFNTLASSTGLLNIFAAARNFFVSVFSFFAAPLLILSLFQLPLLIIIIAYGIYITWWAIAIYGMFRGG